jgi:4-hydroxythreonine-4-phosphate dehydrogenase
MRKRQIAITMGDPAGIGPEIILRALAQEKVRRLARFLVFGNPRVLEETAERLSLEMPLARAEEPAFADEPQVVAADRMGEAPLLPGRWSDRTGRASLSYIFRAVEACKGGLADGMVTAPISKAAIHRAGCKHPGHTELIADLTGADKVVMMLAGGGLRVALVTTHAALATVPQLATRGEIYGTLVVTHRELRQSFGIDAPRLGVLGLNPHAGESGLLGQEEKVHIRPALDRVREEGVNAQGPLPADTAFHQMLQGKYDVIVAMYHDQGLAPLKTIAFDRGVNVTLGLPIVRTSPDHGTAFDIAGKGLAQETSLVAALETAVRMARARALGPRP